MEHLLHLCCYFIYNWVLFAQKHTALLSTLQRNASTVLCSQQWTQERQGFEKFKCGCRKNEASSQQLLRLPDHGQKPTHCNEVPR